MLFIFDRISIIAAVYLALAVAFGLPSATEAQQDGPGMAPQLVETLCRSCHRDRFATFASNPHSILDSTAWQEQTGRRPACTNCHGDVSGHIQAGGGLGNVFAFREETSSEQSAVCLGCHASSHPEFESSAHALSGMTCTSCHSQHSATVPGTALLQQVESVAARFDDLGATSALCVECHSDKLTAFGFNEHHRLTEGVLECSSCHDPHAPPTRNLLGGFKQQQCMECHSDKGGPFVFEHAASRVEGCTACHSPHGSPNRHLLSHQNTGDLCFSCHANVPQFHLGFSPAGPPRFGSDTQCTNCHSAIHGSNFSPVFLR
jgi:DmsE family decaheme c-type cytochrome